MPIRTYVKSSAEFQGHEKQVMFSKEQDPEGGVSQSPGNREQCPTLELMHLE